MIKIYSELVTILLTIGAGIILRKFKIIKKEDAGVLLGLVFYITMPALILSKLPVANISYDYLYLPLIPILVGIITYLAARYFSGFLNLERKTMGVFIISALILNTGFVMPFVVLYFGEEGLSRIMFLDVGNVLVVFLFAYYQACKYGNHQVSNKQIALKFAGAIPIWAIFIALGMNYLKFRFLGPFGNFINITGDLTIPLLLIGVGIFFTPALVKRKAMVLALFIRMGIGMLVGYFFVELFNLEGLTRTVAILGTATPIGYNTLVFASVENLDKEFAAALVSTSILISLVYIPVIIYLNL
ncbi:MAG: AEC family transporter [Bacteroidales bacterium]